MSRKTIKKEYKKSQQLNRKAKELAKKNESLSQNLEKIKREKDTLQEWQIKVYALINSPKVYNPIVSSVQSSIWAKNFLIKDLKKEIDENCIGETLEEKAYYYETLKRMINEAIEKILNEGGAL